MRLLETDYKNFGSLYDVQIDLTAISSATVSGNNGNGKSTAFITAIMWALWGEAPSNVDSWIALGEQDMAVGVTFSVGPDVYRVRRARSVKTKAGKTDLSFAIRERDGTWKPIGGNGVNATQTAIAQTLNADHDLCVNTNFFVQGDAGRFSTSTAGKRRAILAQVIRLEHYDQLRILAQKELNGEEKRLAVVKEAVRTLNAEAALAGRYLEELERLNGEEIAWDQKIKAVQGDIERAVQALAADQERGAALERVKTDLAACGREREAHRERLGALSRELHGAEQLISRRQLIEDAKTSVEALNEMISAIEAEQTEAETVAATEEKKLANLHERCRKADDTVIRLRNQAHEAEQAIKAAHERHSREVQYRTETLEAERRKVELLGQVPCWEALQKQCQFTIEATQAKDAIPALEVQLAEFAKQDAAAVMNPRYVAEREERRTQLKEHEANLAALREEVQGLTAITERLQQARRARVERIKEYREKRGRYQADADMMPRLEAATREAERLRSLIASTQAGVLELEKKSQTLTAEVDRLTKQAEDGVFKRRQLEEWRGNLTSWQQERRAVQERVGATRTNFEAAELAAKQAEDKRVELEMLENQVRRLGYLTKAYTQIPIFMMEEAVPALEEHTNAILDQISKTGMRVRLETQKAMKSREGMAETLDIIVIDRFGERPYENYSGGEKFRLNLAIRLGLADLLMHRAGATLETLVIDEGLGSLDADGLANLRECLVSLESRFGLILVISHIPGVLGTFPADIHFSRRPTARGETLVEVAV